MADPQTITQCFHHALPLTTYPLGLLVGAIRKGDCDYAILADRPNAASTTELAASNPIFIIITSCNLNGTRNPESIASAGDLEYNQSKGFFGIGTANKKIVDVDYLNQSESDGEGRWFSMIARVEPERRFEFICDLVDKTSTSTNIRTTTTELSEKYGVEWDHAAEQTSGQIGRSMRTFPGGAVGWGKWDN